MQKPKKDGWEYDKGVDVIDGLLRHLIEPNGRHEESPLTGMCALKDEES